MKALNPGTSSQGEGAKVSCPTEHRGRGSVRFCHVTAQLGGKRLWPTSLQRADWHRNIPIRCNVFVFLSCRMKAITNSMDQRLS